MGEVEEGGGAGRAGGEEFQSVLQRGHKVELRRPTRVHLPQHLQAHFPHLPAPRSMKLQATTSARRLLEKRPFFTRIVMLSVRLAK